MIPRFKGDGRDQWAWVRAIAFAAICSIAFPIAIDAVPKDPIDATAFPGV